MHTVSKAIRSKIQHLKADSGTKSGILKIYEHSGKLKTPADVRYLTDQERDWFAQGFEEYLTQADHPVRSFHGQIHYGRAIYILSLLYYLSLTSWLFSIVNFSNAGQHTIEWGAVWVWIVFVSVINIALTIYGVHLELLAYKKKLGQAQRLIASIAVIVLVIGIISNLLAPYNLHSENVGTHMFISGEL